MVLAIFGAHEDHKFGHSTQSSAQKIQQSTGFFDAKSDHEINEMIGELVNPHILNINQQSLGQSIRGPAESHRQTSEQI